MNEMALFILVNTLWLLFCTPEMISRLFLLWYHHGRKVKLYRNHATKDCHLSIHALWYKEGSRCALFSVR